MYHTSLGLSTYLYTIIFPNVYNTKHTHTHCFLCSLTSSFNKAGYEFAV